MKKEDYLNRHIPHRVNLLITFRERFSNLTEKEIEDLDLRDLYRCSKDISIMMVRFFLEELGLKLIEGTKFLKNSKPKQGFLLKLEKDKVDGVSEYNSIVSVLVAANRAVAHITAKDVFHDLDTHENTLKILIPVINYTEQKIISNIYLTEQAYKDSMSMKDNEMNRRRII